MEPIRADNSLGLIVPRRTSVVVSMTKAVDREFPCGGADIPCPDRIRPTLAYKRANDWMCTRIRECCARVQAEIRNQAALRDPEVVSLTDARAAMTSKSRSTVHNEVGVSVSVRS